ncbi:MAG: phosphate/phosphite/phosphonate ABC transporter substrate-binding protein [Myxococcota bacterium]
MERLVFGAGPIALPQEIRSPRRRFAERLARGLGVEVITIVASSYPELRSLVARGEAHVAWLPPAIYAHSAEHGTAELLLGTVRAGGGRFRGALFVTNKSPLHDVSELAGKRVAWVDRTSCAGYLFPRLALRSAGCTPGNHFAEEILVGSHRSVTRAVALGRVDCGATYVDGYGDDARYGWSLEVDCDEMRAILFTPPIPSDTICAAPTLEEGIRKDISDLLLRMHQDPEGADVLQSFFGVERFVRARKQDYEIVHQAFRTDS